MKPNTHQPKSVSKVMLAIGIVWTVMSLIFAVTGIRFIKAERLYESNGATVDGVIASKRMEEKNGIDRETKRPIITRTYFLKLKFADEHGRPFEVENGVSKERWDGATEQAPVQIQYLRDDPARCRIAGDSGQAKARVFTTLGVAGVLMGLACLYFCIRKNRP